MSSIFNYDNKFLNGISKIVDSIVLGGLWMICSIPVITIGASSTAFYYAYNKSVRQKRGYTYKEFFHAFKTNFKQSTLGWLLSVALYIVTFLDFSILYVMLETSDLAKYLLIVIFIVFLLLTIWVLYFFPYVARFQNTTKEAMKNCLLIMLANLPWSVLLVLLFLAAAAAFLLVPLISILVPTIYIVFANLILEHVFRKYMTEEDLEEAKILDRE